MHKYLAVLFALLALTACAGGSGTNTDAPNGDDAVADNRFDWSSDDGDDVTDDSSDVTTVEEEPAAKTVKVSISGTVPEDIIKNRELNEPFTAEGGSGNFEWEIEPALSSTYSFPEWVHLSATTGEAVSIMSDKAPEGRYKFKVKVCDAENRSNCKKKTFKVTVNSMNKPAPTGVIEECRGFKPVISEVPTTGIPALYETGLNPVTFYTGSIDRGFAASGGVAPYTWTFKMESEDEVYYCEYHDDPTCATEAFRDRAWDESDVDEENQAIFNVKGSFMHGVAYCDDVRDAGGRCDGKSSLRDAIKLQVTDKCGTVSDVKQYGFLIDSPEDKISDIFIEARLKGFNLDKGEQYIRFELLGLGDDGEERVLAKTRDFSPQEDYDTYLQRFIMEPDVNRSLVHSRITSVRLYLWEQAGCDLQFKVKVTRVKISGRYWYLERNKDKEVGGGASANCSQDPQRVKEDLITFTDGGSEWLRYSHPLSEDDIPDTRFDRSN